MTEVDRNITKILDEDGLVDEFIHILIVYVKLEWIN
jgi:hypothetical protein